MYDDKWTEVNNNQNDQNNQSGSAGGWEPDRDGPARPDSRYTGSAARDSPRTRIRARRTSSPQYQNGPQNQYHHSSPYPYGGQDGNGGMNGRRPWGERQQP